jgi:hypothetical protein
MGDFSIFLIYGQGRSDDVIRIKPLMDKFRVNYVSRDNNVNHFMYCTNEQAFRYVDDLLYLLPPDSEPFSSIQFNFPCMPVLMYRLSDLRTPEVRYSLRDRVAALLDNWPEARPLLQIPPSVQPAPVIISLQELMAAYSQEGSPSPLA